MEGKDIRSFDWDDGPLRRAFEKWEVQKKGIKGKKNSKKEKNNKKHKWNVGDYCRALYSGNLYYEAKIISLNGDFCTIKFLGCDEKRDVGLLELKESEGRKAQWQQIKVHEECLSDDNSSSDEGSDESVESHNSDTKKKHEKKSANKATGKIPVRRAPSHQWDLAPPVARAPPSSMPVTLPRVRRPAPKPQCSVPPAPPMLPQNSTLAKNPDISSLITAWYMAGYYTALQEAKAGNQGYGCHSTTPVKTCCKK